MLQVFKPVTKKFLSVLLVAVISFSSTWGFWMPQPVLANPALLLPALVSLGVRLYPSAPTMAAAVAMGLAAYNDYPVPAKNILTSPGTVMVTGAVINQALVSGAWGSYAGDTFLSQARYYFLVSSTVASMWWRQLVSNQVTVLGYTLQSFTYYYDAAIDMTYDFYQAGCGSSPCTGMPGTRDYTDKKNNRQIGFPPYTGPYPWPSDLPGNITDGPGVPPEFTNTPDIPSGVYVFPDGSAIDLGSGTTYPADSVPAGAVPVDNTGNPTGAPPTTGSGSGAGTGTGTTTITHPTTTTTTDPNTGTQTTDWGYGDIPFVPFFDSDVSSSARLDIMQYVQTYTATNPVTALLTGQHIALSGATCSAVLALGVWGTFTFDLCQYAGNISILGNILLSVSTVAGLLIIFGRRQA